MCDTTVPSTERQPGSHRLHQPGTGETLSCPPGASSAGSRLRKVCPGASHCCPTWRSACYAFPAMRCWLLFGAAPAHSANPPGDHVDRRAPRNQRADASDAPPRLTALCGQSAKRCGGRLADLIFHPRYLYSHIPIIRSLPGLITLPKIIYRPLSPLGLAFYPEATSPGKSPPTVTTATAQPQRPRFR